MKNIIDDDVYWVTVTNLMIVLKVLLNCYDMKLITVIKSDLVTLTYAIGEV